MLDAVALLSYPGSPLRLGDDDGGSKPRRNRTEHMVDPSTTDAAFYGRAIGKRWQEKSKKKPSVSVREGWWLVHALRDI